MRYVLEYCVDNANGWVVENLRLEGNSVFPSGLITEEEDIRIGEKLMSAIMHCRIRIRKTQWGYVCEK